MLLLVKQIVISSFFVLCVCQSIYAAPELELIFAVTGENRSERMKFRVVSPGDMNGDGYSEVLITAIPSGAFPDEGFNRVYVFNGGDPADTEPLRIYTFERTPYPHLVGDIVGDSRPELAVQQWSFTTPNQSVLLYVDCGNGFANSLPDLEFVGGNSATAGFGDRVGSGMISDSPTKALVISAPYSSYPSSARYSIYDTTPDLDTICDRELVIDPSFSNDTYRALTSGDLNDDGFLDFVISTYANEVPSALYILFGSEQPDTIADVIIPSPWGYKYFGKRVVPLGDINQDGYDDLIILSSNHPGVILFGGDPINTTLLELDREGTEAANCGDINDDGWDDIVMSEWEHNLNEGIVYIYFGGNPLDTEVDIIINHEDLLPVVATWLGQSVSAAGDFNGDGIDDLAVGASSSYNQNPDKGYLLIFAGRKIVTGAEDEIGEIAPSTYDVLHQNYPNPFNATTRISFEVRRSSQVELVVYNVLGQEVSRLVSGRLGAGDYTVEWRGEDYHGGSLPTGVYFYKLRTDYDIQARKMIYLK